MGTLPASDMPPTRGCCSTGMVSARTASAKLHVGSHSDPLSTNSVHAVTCTPMAASDRMAWCARNVTVPVVAPAAHAAVNVPPLRGHLGFLPLLCRHTGFLHLNLAH